VGSIPTVSTKRRCLIDFIVIVLVVYFGVKLLGLDKLDKKKESGRYRY
jgi:hypothetical protein